MNSNNPLAVELKSENDAGCENFSVKFLQFCFDQNGKPGNLNGDFFK